MWPNDVNIFTLTHTACTYTTHLCVRYTQKGPTQTILSRHTEHAHNSVCTRTMCPCVTFMRIKHTGVHTYIHANWFLTGSCKDVTLPSATLSIYFYFDDKGNSRREKMSPSENSEGKNSQDIVMYFWLFLVGKRII